VAFTRRVPRRIDPVPVPQRIDDNSFVVRPGKKVDSKGVIWFTIMSLALEQQGYVSADEQNAYVKQVKASPDRCPA
jgi:hypothetical protein